METPNDGIDESRIKLSVLKEINQVIRGLKLDKKQTLTVGDISYFIDAAIANVRKAEKLEKSKGTHLNKTLKH